jgi:hypothetical protein
MLLRSFVLAVMYSAVCGACAHAQPSLPLVEDVESGPLKKHINRLQEVIQHSLSATDQDALRNFGSGKDDISEGVQKLLDPYCLISVTINPESRVKAARGPRTADLVQGKETLILIKVQNDAGVTQGLKVSGDQLRTATVKDKEHWLEADVHDKKPLDARLSGQKLEYVVLRLKAHELGKREATLKFDVGQGTQDLGFRAEVPILFVVKAAK